MVGHHLISITIITKDPLLMISLSISVSSCILETDLKSVCNCIVKELHRSVIWTCNILLMFG